jgi:hypothetical protein
MPGSLLTILILLFLAAAVWSWRDETTPPHVTLGFLILSLGATTERLRDQAPMVSKALLFLNIVLAATTIWQWQRWRRRRTP